MAVEGVLHALSAGILLYTGLVEVSLGTTSSSSLISALIRANLTVLATCARDPVQPKDDLGERGQGDVYFYVHLGRERDHGSDRILGVKKPVRGFVLQLYLNTHRHGYISWTAGLPRRMGVSIRFGIPGGAMAIRP